MAIGLDAMSAISPAGDSRAGEVLRLRREISRMQRRRSDLPLLPVDDALAPLLPDQGLQAGAAYTVSPSPSLVLALLSAASRRGLWCAVVGMPTLGVEAAAAFGIELPRLILVPDPGDRWLAATSALAEVVPLIAVQPGGRVRDADVSRLSARLRDRGSTLLVTESEFSGAWPQSEGAIRLHDQQWEGIGEGWGLIEGSTATVTARTRHTPTGASVRVRLPGSHGAVEAISEQTTAETVAELTALPGLRGGDVAPPEYPLAVAG
ncbi:hypothetical protein [Microbacterium sp. 1.5R]|uniref:hypothetical protein n=1 Tax=Microbacterium sp. 1.5R TaxID=1916917 RepID=UPI0011A0EF2A|nr:hypothetical protein [Microbacterium sp. 1.5R]